MINTNFLNSNDQQSYFSRAGLFCNIKLAIRSLKEGEQPLIHSNRGIQYTTKGFKEIVDKAKLTQR
ncbi:hypothetical protein [Bacillus mycoides]|uniref:hypothetical protein n=1 Tax=Lysinibacillus sphaericus TaxID=1421 RepID=UPI001C6003E3